jgi:excisionase family DNA binding protein
MEGYGAFRTFTATEAAAELGIARTTVYRMIKSGEIQTLPLGPRHRVRISSAELARVSGAAGEAGTADDAPQVVTVMEASRITGLSVRTLYDAIDSGVLPAFMPAGAQRGIRIRRADLARAVCAGVGR